MLSARTSIACHCQALAFRYALLVLAIAIIATIQADDLCSVETFDGRLIQVFVPLEVACPAVGERLAASFNFQFANSDSNTISTTNLSVAVSHGSNGLFNRTDGLVATADTFATGGCPFAPQTTADIDVLFGATTPNLACNGNLSSNTRLCSAFSYQGIAGNQASFGIIVLNTGACKGSMMIEANLVDAKSDSSNVSACLSPIQPRCDGSFAPTPLQAILPTSETVEAATTKSPSPIAPVFAEKPPAIPGSDSSEPTTTTHSDASHALPLLTFSRAMVAIGILATLIH
ncbi:hypothetical protein MPSEU_000611100 [Mayamaea pseudoterrestris]|nr:hypothetical protein MPSEU_000611100 [Mayamaea pseudoterrestris]